MVKRNKSKLKTFFTSFFALVLGLVVGFVANIYTHLPNSYEIPGTIKGQSTTATTGKIDVEVVKSNDLSIHFLELGNKYTGDCTLIKAGSVEMLIDAGSKENSIETIQNYLNVYVEGKLDYVVVTHAHEDHYAGFATADKKSSLFDKFEIGTIIEFSKTNKTTSNKMYYNYIKQRDDAVADYNTVVYDAMDFFNGTASNNFELSNDVYCQILYQEFYEKKASSENDYSVCLQIVQGTKKYLFTGDLEKDGEESLITDARNAGKLTPVELYKAGHHGSKTSSSKSLLDIIQPKIVCVCCCAGSSEYTSKSENQFPTQEFIDRVSVHTKQIFVTTLCVDYKQNKYESFNGNIVVCSNLEEDLAVYCSNNTTYLKDTEWFKSNRTLPENAVV